MKMELRTCQSKMEVRAEPNKLFVSGYVNETGTLSKDLGGYREIIAPGVFAQAIESAGSPIDFLYEHRTLLASEKNGSLRLKEDDKGLYMEAEIVNTTNGRDAYEMITSGLISNMSFGFACQDDTWERRSDGAIRTVKQMKLFEVSAVHNPAYLASNLSARSIEQTNINIEENLKMNKEIKVTNTNAQQENREFNEFLSGQTKRYAELRAVNTTTGASLVPTNVASLIYQYAVQAAPILGLVKKFPSNAGSLKVPRETNITLAGFVGEGLNVAEVTPALTHLTLTQKRCGAFVTVTDQLMNDSFVNMDQYVPEYLGRSLGLALELSLIKGTAATEFVGLKTDALCLPVNKTVANSKTYAAMIELMNKIHPNARKNAKFLMSQDLFTAIEGLVDGNGHYFLQNGVVNGEFQYSIAGHEVMVSDNMDAGATVGDVPAIFGDFSAIAFLEKQGVDIKRIDNDQTNAIAGTVVFVADTYADAALANTKSMAKIVII